MNAREQRLYDALDAKGLEVHRRGWPDFLIVDEKRGLGCALELKCGSDKLSDDQRAMHAALLKFGLPTFVVHEDFIADANRRGRKLLLPRILSDLRAAADRLESKVRQDAYELAQLRAEIDSATVIFEDSGQPELFADRRPREDRVTDLGAAFEAVFGQGQPSGSGVFGRAAS